MIADNPVDKHDFTIFVPISFLKRIRLLQRASRAPKCRSDLPSGNQRQWRITFQKLLQLAVFDDTKEYLVGGFNTPEKYERQLG